MRKLSWIFLLLLTACSKKPADQPSTPVTPVNFSIQSWSVDGSTGVTSYVHVKPNPVIRLGFQAPINRTTVNGAIKLNTASAVTVPYSVDYASGDSVLIVQPSAALDFLSRYSLVIGTGLQSKSGGRLTSPTTINLYTQIDSTDKFARISDDALLTLVQRQTFRYFWDFAHPVSGLARERNTSGDVVTTGGSGFGIMAIPAAVERGFITRAQALTRMQTVVGFLKNTAQKFHGAFPHWLNGTTGVVVPFSAKDNGADLVETSFLMMGLITARQYFNDAGTAETNLRNDINTIYNAVEWSWFRKNNEQVLYWHWSPNFAWDMNLPIRGWNECLITYVLAASSTTHTIPKTVYDQGWAKDGTMRNGNPYYNITLPLGPNLGGPLFFSHYSFLGINPTGLVDAYANYQDQVVNHSRINFEYCKANPRSQVGYSDQCWGLTASDIPGGYTASSPTNDVGVIAPTAALSSMPFTPNASMAALRFFYYKLGDKIWKDYGFVDAFHLGNPWFADSFLAIDQGPIVVMIENHRSQLIWNLFMSAPEVKAGMRKLGFTGPNL